MSTKQEVGIPMLREEKRTVNPSFYGAEGRGGDIDWTRKASSLLPTGGRQKEETLQPWLVDNKG